jgi:hypothetical protein
MEVTGLSVHPNGPKPEEECQTPFGERVKR